MDAVQNILFLADSYKISHYKQYPPGTTRILSYFESRGGKFDHVVFFGLQYILKRWLSTRVTAEMVQEADEFYGKHFVGGQSIFNRPGWDYIVEKHGGKIPVKVMAVPEGSRVPVKNVLFTVENTDPEVPWITNYFETVFVQVWYPLTVCTNSNMQKQVIRQFMAKTADDLTMLDTKLHDFGYRGSSSVESAGIGGCAHLANFSGTDNIAAILTANKYYKGKSDMPGMSLPASEHSTMTTWGKDKELEAVDQMMDSFPEGPLSVVADSYNLWNFLDNIIGKELKEKIVARNGTLVIRPDSGDPLTIVMKVLSKLGASFPPKKNDKGYKLLPLYVRVIQGDGISYEKIKDILTEMEKEGWSADNIVFGSGGALLQKLDRDTQKCAYKCCMAEINGKLVDVFKQPITDMGKQSKKGNVTLVQTIHGQYKTIRKEEITGDTTEVLVEVFNNGQLKKEWTLDEIRERINQDLEAITVQ